MTITNDPQTSNAGLAPAQELVNIVIDGVEMAVPKGTLVIRAAEQIGIEIPRFCDHPLLTPVAACRACLIEIDGVPKPQPACAQTVSDGMNIKTQHSSEVARIAQEGVMEFLLVNHPLDCPICDKGGECPLQNQAMSVGRPESRFEGEKRTFPKPINVNAQILLDRERCVSCARCTRFADEIAGDPSLELLERGAQQQVGTADDQPFDSYYSGNTVQICPVGALTSASYRFRSRPFDLVSVPTTCEHCASGCSLRTDTRRGVVTRRLAWDDPEVNQEWNCDKGRFAFSYLRTGRIELPLIRENGEFRPASWPEAMSIAAQGLARAGSEMGVLIGGRSTIEDAYAYSKFARTVMATDNIDFRARASSTEEAQFLASNIAGRTLATTYRDLDSARTVLLIAFEPEDESPIVLLRLRSAVKGGASVHTLAPAYSLGSAKLDANWIQCLPGEEATALKELDPEVRNALSQPGAVVLVGERAATIPGALTAISALVGSTGAKLGWIPRRAGERGALEAGALAGLLPSGRPIEDPQARAEVAAVWNVEAQSLPRAGVTGSELISAIANKTISAVLTGGVQATDLPEGVKLLAALEAADFVVALDSHHSEITEIADVVFPVAVVTEKAGTFMDWEGRAKPFGAAFRDSLTLPDSGVLAMLASAAGHTWTGETRALRSELASLATWTGARASAPTISPAPTTGQTPTLASSEGGFTLSTWRQLLDSGLMQEGEPHLAATARPSVARISEQDYRALGSPSALTVTGPQGSITLPAEMAQIVTGTVWLPMNSPDSHIYTQLGCGYGAAVSVRASALSAPSISTGGGT
jgi:NADH-quinone oxidoreductase subunit G